MNVFCGEKIFRKKVFVRREDKTPMRNEVEAVSLFEKVEWRNNNVSAYLRIYVRGINYYTGAADKR